MSFKVYAGPNSRFGVDAFESQIGKVLPLRVADVQVGECVITAVTTSDDGEYVTIAASTDAPFRIDL